MYRHSLPGHLDALVGGVDVDEQFAGPAEVFALPHRKQGRCGDTSRGAQCCVNYLTVMVAVKISSLRAATAARRSVHTGWIEPSMAAMPS